MSTGARSKRPPQTFPGTDKERGPGCRPRPCDRERLSRRLALVVASVVITVVGVVIVAVVTISIVVAIISAVIAVVATIVVTVPIIIGAIVTGREAETIESATRSFAQALQG